MAQSTPKIHKLSISPQAPLPEAPFGRLRTKTLRPLFILGTFHLNFARFCSKQWRPLQSSLIRFASWVKTASAIAPSSFSCSRLAERRLCVACNEIGSSSTRTTWESRGTLRLRRHRSPPLGVELSTQRVGACARHFFDDILRTIYRGSRPLPRRLAEVLAFLSENAHRAHPNRDRLRGRLAAGLRPVSTTGARGARTRGAGAR